MALSSEVDADTLRALFEEYGYNSVEFFKKDELLIQRVQGILEVAMSNKISCVTGTLNAVIVDCYPPSKNQINVDETIKKLYKLANSSLPSD